jgi:LmbE family N-acetylglucosaminyl deacetylase
VSRILAIGRSAPELAALAGGTLTKLSATDDDLFIAEAPTAAAAEGSAGTGEAVAGALGAEWLGSVPIGGDEDGRSVRDPVMDVIRRARPDLIVVSAPEADEWMPLSELVFNAAYCSTIPNYLSPTGLDPASVRAPIVSIDQPRARDFAPDEYVDITEQWPAKVELLELCGDAADGELRDLAEVSSRARGIQVQVEFAEAFRIERAWGRLRPYRLLP